VHERAVVRIALVNFCAALFAPAGNANIGAAARVNGFLDVFPFANHMAYFLTMRLATTVGTFAKAAVVVLGMSARTGGVFPGEQ
jgi:hypothetical protein